MKNLHTRKTSNGSNFGWLIRQTSINQKSGRQTFRRRFVSGSLFVSPCPPECYLQSETKIAPDLRLRSTRLRRNHSRPPEPVVRLNIKPSGSWNENAAESEGRRHRDCTWKASGTQGICPYALLLFSVSPWLSWPSWGAGRARVWRKVGPARRPRRLMTLPSQQGDPPSPTFCFSRERLVRFLKEM